MARFLIIGSVLAVLFYVASLVDCASQPAIRHRGVKKSFWVLIVAVLPVIGGILWFTLGRTRKNAPMHAPDDDDAFLNLIANSNLLDGSNHSAASTKDADERIRQLEEELARLDSEDGDGGTHRDDDGAGGTQRDEDDRRTGSAS